MISYDKYQNRIKRVAAVKNFIVRFRWPIIAVFALLIAGSLALMFTKGMVTQKMVLPENVVYGDYYEDGIKQPKAFLSDARYQFKRIDDRAETKTAAKYSLTDSEVKKESGWTYELPTLAGKYLVRTVTNKIFGKSYSNTAQFEIATKSIEFVIKSDSVVYGEMPASYEFNTIRGDNLDKNAVRFIYKNPQDDSTIVKADENSFKIYNSKGEDVTFCYDITTPETEEEINILPKSETLAPREETLKNSSWAWTAEYIGGEVAYTNSVYHWKGGDVVFTTKISGIAGEIEGNPVTVGNYTVEIIDAQVFSGEDNVTGHYNISFLKSFIKINRRPVTVTTPTLSKEYDGGKFDKEKAEAVEADLITGHSFKAVFDNYDVVRGTYVNSCAFTIFDGNDDVTENYNISYDFGVLEITARKITLKTESYSKVYDGTTDFDITEASYKVTRSDETAFVGGHSSRILNHVCESSDVGTYDNDISIIIVDEAGFNQTFNYEIENDFGSLTITEREIQITSKTQTFDYNGYPQGTEGYASAVLLSEIEGITDALPEGEEIYVYERTEVTYFTAEAVENVIVCRVRKYYGGDTTSNYKISYKNGQILVNSSEITVFNAEKERQYNGEKLFGDDESIFDGLLFGGDYAVPEKVTEILYFGEILNETTYVICNSDGEDVSDSYKINYKNENKLIITQADLTIYTPTVQKIYDGTALYGDQEEYGEAPRFDGLAKGERYEPYDATENTEYGSVENKTQYNFYASVDGVEVQTTANYRVMQVVCGEVKINKRPVWIVTPDGSREYNGEKFTLLEGGEAEYPETGEYGILSNHTLKVNEDEDNAFIIDVGDTPNIVYFQVFEGEREVTHNYDLDANSDFGTLCVTERLICIATDDGEWTYADEDYSKPVPKNIVHLNSSRLPDNKENAFVLDHTYSVRTEETVHDVIYYRANTCVYDVVDGSGTVVTSNYDIMVNPGALVVNKRPIIVTTATEVIEYDGKDHCNTAYEKQEGGEVKGEKLAEGLLENHELFAKTDDNGNPLATTVNKVMRNGDEVKGTDNEVEYAIFKGDIDVSENYEIKTIKGTLTVTPREITITTPESYKEFDGEEFFDYSVNADEVLKNSTLADGHCLVAEEYATVTFVTEGKITNEVIYSIQKDGEDLTENYDITPEYGEIWITKRYVLVTTNSHTWTYDGDSHYDTNYTDVHLVDVVLDGDDYVSGNPDESTFGLLPGHRLGYVSHTSVTDVVENKKNNVQLRFVDDMRAFADNYYLVREYGTLTILPRPIIITTGSAEKVYDGDSFSYTEGWSVEGGEVDGVRLEIGLVKNHTLALEQILTEITDVAWVDNIIGGTVCGVPNEVIYKVIDGDGSDAVNGNYSITYKHGTLKRLLRPIEISTDGDTREYDGTPLVCALFSAEPCSEDNTRGLVQEKFNHSVVLDEDEKIGSITYIIRGENGELVFSTENERHYRIFAGAEDKTGNYKISYDYGMLTLTKRTVTITTPTLSQTYNGRWLYGDNESFEPLAKIDNLVEGEIYYATTSRAQIRDYIEDGIENDTKYRISVEVDGLFIDTTNCYDIKYSNGRLSIIKKDLEITRLSPKKIYDGKELLGNDEELDENFDEEIYFKGKVKGETYLSFNETSITDFGTKANLTEYRIYAEREDGVKETTENYNISYKEGTLTVDKRVIWVVSGSDEHEYDGEGFSCLDGWYITSELDLVEGHTLDAILYTQVTDVKRDSDYNPVAYTNVVQYVVLDTENIVHDVNKNYVIEYLNADGEEEYGTLLVTPRIVRVITDDGKWVYDGKYKSAPGESYEHGRGTSADDFIPDGKDAFVLDHELSRLTAREEKNVDEYENKCTYDVIDKANGDETVLYNYTLYIVNGTLIITARPIIVTTDAGVQEYDGTPLKSEGFTAQEYATDEGLAEGHNAELKEGEKYVSITNVPESGAENKILIAISDEEGFDVTENYEIDYRYGILTVTPRVVLITTASTTSGEWTYDGKEHSKTNLVAAEHGGFDEDGNYVPDSSVNPLVLVLDHDYSLIFEYIVIDAGSYPNECDYDIVDGNNDSVIYNYNLIIHYGTLEIGKRQLIIEAAILEKVYDGQPLMGDDTSEEYGDPVYVEGLAESEYLSAYDIAKITNFGSVINNTQYDVYAERDGEPTRTTENYDIDYTAGSLTVNKRAIWIITDDVTEEYDGNEHTGEASWSLSEDYYGLVEKHTLRAVDIIGKLTNVSWTDDEVSYIDNEVTYKVVDENGDDSVNENYDVRGYTYGKLTVLPRNISVKTATDSKYYDGDPLTNTEDFLITSGSVLEKLGHRLGVALDCEITSVTDVDEGEVPNELIYVVYENDGSVSRNYTVSPDGYGMLRIIALPISIVLNPVDDMYYGDPFSGYPAGDAEWDYATGSEHIIDGEQLIISVKYQYDNKDIDVENDRLSVGTYFVVLADKRIEGGKLDNYDISISDGNSFEIFKRAITIKLIGPKESEKVYDGKVFRFGCEEYADVSLNGGYEIVEGETYYGDVITISVIYSKNGSEVQNVLDAGEYIIIFNESGCNVGGDYDIAANYAIGCITESLSYEISRRPILFTFGENITHEYTGLPFEPNGSETIFFDRSQLAENDSFAYANGSAMKDGELVDAIYAGEYEYVVSQYHIFRITDSSDSSKNYYLSEEQESGRLEITQRQIKVSVVFGGIAGHDYTGEPIDLIGEYPDYGPYITEPVTDTANAWGIYSDDLDSLEAVFTVMQDNAVVDLMDLGTYNISVLLKDREGSTIFKDNYLPVYEDSDYEITWRRITVKAKMTGENLIYNGEKLNTDFLDFDSEHVYSDEEGFLDNDVNDYIVTYYLYEAGGNGENLLNEILQAGSYYLALTLEYNNSDKEEHYFIETVSESEVFTVQKRNLFIVTPDDTTDYVYNKQPAKKPKDSDCEMLYYDGSLQPGGFVNNDGDGVTFIYSFYSDNGQPNPEAVNAGTYTIKVVDFNGGNTEFLNRNYSIEEGYPDDFIKHGTLSIRPAKLVLAPHGDYYVDYKGTNNKVTMPKDNFEIKYVEGKDDCTLFESASIYATFTNELNVTKAAATRVSIKGVSIYEGTDDITSNYKPIYTYTLLRELLPEKVEELTQADFFAIIGYNQQKITVRQPTPPAGYEKVEYGFNKAITLSEPWVITEYVENAAQVLFNGHRVEVGTARVTATSLGKVEQWLLRCKVLTDSGEDVSFGYDITISCGESSQIEVETRKISVKINISLEGLADRDLEAGEYTLTEGSLVFGGVMTVSLKEGRCVVTIKDRAEEDLTDCYDVNVIYLEDENNLKEAENASWI